MGAARTYRRFPPSGDPVSPGLATWCHGHLPHSTLPPTPFPPRSLQKGAATDPPLARFEVIEDGFGRKRAALYPPNPRPNNKYRHGDGNELSAIARPSPLESALPESPLLHDRLGTDNQQLERVRGMGTAIINAPHAQERFLRVPPSTWYDGWLPGHGGASTAPIGGVRRSAMNGSITTTGGAHKHPQARRFGGDGMFSQHFPPVAALRGGSIVA